MATTPQIPDQGHILRMPDFRTLWLAQFVSIFGDFLALFGIISLITFRMHGNAVQVTTMTVAYILPLAIFGPPMGVLVDHFDARKTMIVSDLVRGALILLLLVVHNVSQIAAVMFAISVVSCFFMPAQSVTVRTIVPKDRLLHATAALSQAFYIIRIASPLIAGAIVATLSERATFIVDAFSFGISALLISRLHFSRPPREGADKSMRGLTRDFVEGNRFIFTHPGLSFVFIAMAVAMFVLSSFSPLISIFVRDQLHAGAMLFGVVSGMVGVGLILGTSMITRIAGRRPQPGVVLVGLLMTGVATSVLGASYHGWEAAVSMFLLGFAVSLVLIPAQTMSQQETPVEMAGRVSSTFMSMISVAQILGLLLSGTLAEKLGVRQLFFYCTAFVILISGAGWLYLRSRVATPPQPATE